MLLPFLYHLLIVLFRLWRYLMKSKEIFLGFFFSHFHHVSHYFPQRTGDAVDVTPKIGFSRSWQRHLENYTPNNPTKKLFCAFVFESVWLEKVHCSMMKVHTHILILYDTYFFRSRWVENEALECEGCEWKLSARPKTSLTFFSSGFCLCPWTSLFRTRLTFRCRAYPIKYESSSP